MKEMLVYKKDIDDISCYTPPSPVVLVSTVSKEGIRNLAPVSSFVVCSYDPPMVLFVMQPCSHTAKNINETSDFVIGIPNERIVNKVFMCSQNIPAGEDEFIYADLTPINSHCIQAYNIEECIINLECKAEWTKESGDHIVICGQVVLASIKEKNIDLNKLNEFREKIDLISHIHANKFLVGHNHIVTI